MMAPLLRSVAVLGAGTMGAQIAAHFANAGVPVLLLDLTADVAREGLARATSAQARSLLHAGLSHAGLRTGGFDTDLAALVEVDWIIEAVVERLDIKRALLERVDAVRRRGTIVSSNTSGIPIAALAEGRSDDFRRHWLGHALLQPAALPASGRAHPDRRHRRRRRRPRGARSPITGSARASSWRRTRRTSSPISIGVFGVMQTLEALESGRYTIEEIDAITGPALGRPKSATFRTMDIAGIDVLAHVAAQSRASTAAGVPAPAHRSPRAWSARRPAQGFYKRIKTTDGTEILTLDPATLDVSAEAAGADRRRLEAAPIDRRYRRADHDAVRRDGQGRRVPARHARADAASTRRASPPTSPTRSTTSIARCGGDSAGSSARSRCWDAIGMRRGHAAAATAGRRCQASCSRPQPIPRRRRRQPSRTCRF